MRRQNEPCHLVLVGYDRDRTAQAMDLCARAFATLRIDRRVLVVNSPAALPARMPTGWQAVTGSNRLGEFSGWQEGLKQLGTRGSAAALLVNDTFGGQRHPSVLRRWALRREIRDNDGSSWVGFIDRPARGSERLIAAGLDCREWVSTYCFYLPLQVLDRLDGRVFDLEEVERLVPGGTVREKFFSAELSSDLRRHLLAWLFDGGWSRSEPLNADNAGALAFKARCICAELLLSARLRHLGVQLREPMRRNALAAWLDRASENVRPRRHVVQRSPVRP